jgi:putative oxidoreductase
VNNKKIISLSSLSAASLFGWTLFIVLTCGEVRSAIISMFPFLGDTGSVVFFSLMVVFFVVSGTMVYFGVLGDTLPKLLFKLILGAVFMMAAVPKIMDPSGFALDISHYDTFPKFSINIIAITLPWIEGLIALSLILSVLDGGGVILVNLFMAAFLVLLGQAWMRGLDIDCGCFGKSGAGEAVSKAFIRDIFFIFWSVILFFYMRRGDKEKQVPRTEQLA